MKIFIPTPLRPYAGGQSSVDVDAPTVAAAINQLTQSHPELRKHLFTPEGKVRAFVNVYLNDEDVRYLPEKESTAVNPTDTLSIIPSIAGGCWPGLAVQAIAPAARSVHCPLFTSHDLCPLVP